MNPVPPGSTPLAQAVAAREPDTVARLLAEGQPVDSRDERGETALVIATETDQFGIANLLAEHGADLWFADELGFTPAIFAAESSVALDSPEGQQRARFITRLRAAGHPWPPMNINQVKAARAAGNWPPQG